MAELNVASKGITKKGEYWLRCTQDTDFGVIESSFLSVTKALYDKVTEGKTIELPDSLATRVKWEV